MTDRMQSVFNVATQLVYGSGGFDHVTDLVRDRLHWRQVQQEIAFKCALLTYKAQHRLAPAYIARSCVQSSSLHTRDTFWFELHDMQVVPRSKTKFGEWYFTIAGQTVWNTLLGSVKTADSTSIFKFRSFLFGLSYNVWTLSKAPLFSIMLCVQRYINC